MTTRESVMAFILMCREMPANQIGNLVAEYVNEAEHADWEGFHKDYIPGINALLADIVSYRNAQDANSFNHPGFGGIHYYTKPY